MASWLMHAIVFGVPAISVVGALAFGRWASKEVYPND